MQYELFYLIGEAQEADLETIRTDVNNILTEEGATFVEEELTEKRKLAYEIKHQRKGTYITRRFELPEFDYWAADSDHEKEGSLASINNKLNLKQEVLRFMIAKTDELPSLGAKEERKIRELKEAEAATDSRRERNSDRKIARQQRMSQAKAEAKPEAKEEAAKQEDKENIDKKLEEILNI